MTRRISFPAHAHGWLTETALWHARKNVRNTYGELLGTLADCHSNGGLTERVGASYDCLERIGELVGFDDEELLDWFALAESIPLSQAHAGHILGNLERRAA